MTTYIAVYEDYTPEIFTSVKTIAKRFEGYYLDSDNTIKVTVATVRQHLKSSGVLRLYIVGSNDWSFKLFATNKL